MCEPGTQGGRGWFSVCLVISEEDRPAEEPLGKARSAYHLQKPPDKAE